MKRLLAALLMLVVANSYAQNWTYEKDKDVTNMKATVQLLNDGEMAVLNPDGNPSGRYISEQLPKEYKVEGLRVTINGYTGKIPPYVRMMGSPLYITKIWISKAEKKKYKLSKCKYTFKG
ncbi:MAG: hypothetical protein JST49_09160 [Bacteroidetes bacterium]|nr:hypothetical protein [Bacteroidota bacterium]